MVIRKYKIRFKVIKHMVRVCLGVVWGGLVEFWGGLGCFGVVLGCFNGPHMRYLCKYENLMVFSDELKIHFMPLLHHTILIAQ